MMEKSKILIEWHKTKNIETIPEKYGVYIISCSCKDKNGIDKDNVIYTGQSNNLNLRMHQHWSDSEENEKLKKAINKYSKFLTIHYSVVNGKQVDGIEKYLCEYFNPQFQERAPDVEPQPVNLPQVDKGKVKFDI